MTAQAHALELRLQDNNTWFWQLTRSDGSTELSAARLETLADALRDATTHGFVIWSRGEDRRKEETDRLYDRLAYTSLATARTDAAPDASPLSSLLSPLRLVRLSPAALTTFPIRPPVCRARNVCGVRAAEPAE